MNRLTDKRFKREGFISLPRNQYKSIVMNEKPNVKQIYDRLLEIEDILGDEYDIDRLRELVKADRERRCVVFRFGIGSIVYRTWVKPDGSCPFVSKCVMETVKDLEESETWSNAYETEQAAEKALNEWRKEHGTINV